MEADDVARVIMLLKGVMDHGGPFWCYTAIRPSQFDAFKEAEQNGTIDLYDFDGFGEVIVSAEGDHPPQEVTNEVARMYGCNPKDFFKPIDPIAEISQKVAELEDEPPTPEPSPTSWAGRFGRRG